MVLQRELKIPVWGISTPGAAIIAELGNTKATTKADQEGKWMVHLPEFKAGGPYTLKICEKEKPGEDVVLSGILIGDVWIASGQSNMEWQVQQAKDASKEIANKMVYKQDGIIILGPMYRSYQKEGNRIRISFTEIGSGLSTSDGKDVAGFAIAGNDKQFHWAKAVIEGNEVVVYSDEVAEPVAVRYAWADNPECNLINSEGLPAVPFRTDDWKGITQS